MAINEPKNKVALVLLSSRGEVHRVFLCPPDMKTDEAIERADYHAQELTKTDIVEVDTLDDLLEAIDNLNTSF